MGKDQHKRKRDLLSNAVTVSVAKPSSTLSAALGSFPGFIPSDETGFEVYHTLDSRGANQHIVVGRSDEVDFVGQTSGPERVQPLYCKYLVGVYDANRKSVTFQEAPVLRFASKVRRRADVDDDDDDGTALEGWGARNALGEAFGSRKLKKRIQDLERNTVNMEQMESTMGAIHSTIDVKANDPTTEGETSGASDLLPPFNAQTNVATEIYSLDDIISPSEMAVIPVGELFDNANEEKIAKCLPFDDHIRSEFVIDAMRNAFTFSEVNRMKVRQLVYLSYLMRFWAMSHRMINNRSKVAQKLLNPPSLILDNIYAKFTEMSVTDGGEPRLMKTEGSQKKLTCYIFILILLVNGLKIPVNQIARDMRITVSEAVNYCKNIGCAVKVGSETSKGSSKSKEREAVLRAPIKFQRSFRR
ncbi:DNA-directed RNA polymerase I subunit rpa49 [Dimargaris xerosporica]|nr:DNA-directed RNA polymerase I subunit rpa49 [Dimargaris xerosporica]